MSNDQNPAAGWYPAPHANNEQRYWDGQAWLEPQAPAATTTATFAPSPFTAAPAGGPAKRNILAIISLIVAVIGFIFACIPGAILIGWILLPIAFVLAIVSLFLKGSGKAFGIAGLIVAIVGTVVGFVVFFATLALAFGDAVDNGQTVVVTEPKDSEQADAGDKQTVSVEGTRENPFPLGTNVGNEDWTVTINSVTLAANDAVAAAHSFNEPPQAGNEYILVNATITYLGADTEGGLPAFVVIDYVTPTGETTDTTFTIAPDSLDVLSTLYTGGTVTGNLVFEVPSSGAAEGVLAVTPGILADTVFFAVQ